MLTWQKRQREGEYLGRRLQQLELAGQKRLMVKDDMNELPLWPPGDEKPEITMSKM